MATSLIILIVAMGKSCVASRFNPIARVAPRFPKIPFPGGPHSHQLQMKMGTDKASFPEVLKAVGPGQSSRAYNAASDLVQLPANRNMKHTFGLSGPRSFDWRGRVGRSSPAMNMADESPAKMNMADQDGKSPTPQEKRVMLLRQNLQALDGNGDEGKVILAESPMLFDPLDFAAARQAKFENRDFRTELHKASDAAKELDMLLMLHAHPHTSASTSDAAVAGQLAAIRLEKDFDDIPIHTQLVLDLSNHQQASGLIDRYAKAGSDIITFEPDPADIITTASQVTAMLDRIKAHGILSGFVLSLGASVKSIEHLLMHSKLDMVVIKIGGSNHIDKALEKIKEIKSACQKYEVPEPYISVDGEVDENAAPKFLAEGANIIVSGFIVVRKFPVFAFRTNDLPEDPSVVCWLDPDREGAPNPEVGGEFICVDKSSIEKELDQEDSY